MSNELYNKYPKLFAQKDLSEQETCMCWGICCGKGWYGIIDEACQKIEDVQKEYPLFQIEFTQVKEKFGGLRLNFEIKTIGIDYIGTKDYLKIEFCDRINDIISDAKTKSYVTCDVCGKPGKEAGRNWIVTRCEEHTPKDNP